MIGSHAMIDQLTRTHDHAAAPRISSTVARLVPVVGPLLAFMTQWETRLRAAGEAACDFVAGNPREPPIEGYVEALQRWVVPRRRDWFAYLLNEPRAQAAAAASLRERLGLPFEDQDIALTNASIAALAVALRAICDAGDEVVLISPAHFIYEPLAIAAGASAICARVDMGTFDLDLDAIAAALSTRTRALILNTPHNPTGKVFQPSTLRRLADLLTEASERYGTIYLLSDETYSRLVFDGGVFRSPAEFYSNTMIVYSYGKQLLAPAQRIGYLALAPTMPEREQMRLAIALAQLATGYLFPNALLQHALPDLEKLSVDMRRLEARRDHLVAALRRMGYELHVPEATFYLLPRSPVADDGAFCDRLAADDVFVTPGSILEMPGYFRISLTATERMIERSLPVFERAIEEARPR
jgi:aspartate aminotransferase